MAGVESLVTHGPLFHVVLHQPEIPNNTGNIGRTCVALASHLHLIHPLGFDVSEKACRRAGLDYWPRLNVTHHDSWTGYIEANPTSRRWFFTTKASRTIFDVRIALGDHLVFGQETKGLPEEILRGNAETCVNLPMVPDERSLNLATAVCAGMYEGLRQCRDRGEVTLDPQGRISLT